MEYIECSICGIDFLCAVNTKWTICKKCSDEQDEAIEYIPEETRCNGCYRLYKEIELIGNYCETCCYEFIDKTQIKCTKPMRK